MMKRDVIKASDNYSDILKNLEELPRTLYLLVATIDDQGGVIFNSSKNAPLEKSSCPESLYKSTLTKLMLSEWKNSVNCPGLTVLKEVGNSAGSAYSHFAETKVDPKSKREAKKSRSQSSHNQSVKGTGVQVDLKWEYVRRRLALRLLTGLGNFLEHQGQIPEANDFILQSVSILVSRNPSVPPTCFLDLMAKEIPGDVFSVERAEILYSICWLSVKIRSNR
ncbi:hypothetical protein ACLB2K_047189 [Fragaria x ananassa]